MRLGVDFSEHGGALTLQTVECWKAKGVKHAVVQYSYLMKHHLETLKNSGGFELEAYVYLYWGTDVWGQTPMVRTQNALNIIKNYGVKRLWLDAEDTAHTYQESQMRQCEALCYANDIEPGIYTGRWYWVDYAGNSKAFKHLPLWDARYLGEAPVADLIKVPKNLTTGYVPYGGWQQPTIHQWWNTNTFCNHSVDLNALADMAISENEDEMIPFVSRALWFTNRFIPKNTFADHYTMTARLDFGLPQEAKMVRILYKPSTATGYLRFYHGGTDIEAPSVKTYKGWFISDVATDREGDVRFVVDGDTTIKELICDGYWKGQNEQVHTNLTKLTSNPPVRPDRRAPTK